MTYARTSALVQHTAFNMFARAVIKQERIPFEVNSEKQARIQRAWEAAEQIL